MKRPRPRTLGAAALVVALVVAAVVVTLRLTGDDRTELQRAVALAPTDMVRWSWTDWAGIREEVGLDLDAASSAEEVADLLGRGFSAGLTSVSALVESADVMQERLGFSPATLDWELFAQGTTTASLVMRLADDVPTDDVADALAEAGYEEADGVWSSDPATDDITADVTGELAFVALDEEAGLVLASDNADGIRAAIAATEDDGDEPADVDPDVLAGLGDPLSAVVMTGDQVCSQLAMANADADAQQEGAALLEQAGPVNPLLGFGLGAQRGGEVLVTMAFETEDQARTNADTRAVLAAGPAPGQGGDFSERFELDEVVADDEVVSMSLDPVEGAYVLGDLSSGPVLFATC